MDMNKAFKNDAESDTFIQKASAATDLKLTLAFWMLMVWLSY
jgi:hypothetical protein